MDPCTCDRIITTCGAEIQTVKTCEGNTIVIKRRKVGTKGTIGFANSPHIDGCDKLTKQQEESIINDKNELGAGNHYDTMKKYCKKMIDYRGMGLPTTCGYHLCGVEENDGVEVVARFGVQGFSMQLVHNCVHHFHGWCFDHVTFVPILLTHGTHVRISNYPEYSPLYIIGWGTSGGPPKVDNRKRNLDADSNKKRIAENMNTARRKRDAIEARDERRRLRRLRWERSLTPGSKSASATFRAGNGAVSKASDKRSGKLSGKPSEEPSGKPFFYIVLTSVVKKGFLNSIRGVTAIAFTPPQFPLNMDMTLKLFSRGKGNFIYIGENFCAIGNSTTFKIKVFYVEQQPTVFEES